MKRHYIWMAFLIFLVINIGLTSNIHKNKWILSTDVESQKQGQDYIFATKEEIIPKTSTGANYDNLESIFNAKLNEYRTSG